MESFITHPNPEIYLSDNYVVIDYETTNIDKGNPRRRDNRLLYGAYYLGKQHPDRRGRSTGIRGESADEYSQRGLVKAIENADFVVAQNTKFELGWTSRLGVKLETILPYDTILGEYMRAGNRRVRLDLNSIALRYGLGKKEDRVSKLIKAGVCPSEIPRSWLEHYCKQDVILTHEIFLKQRKYLHEQGLLPVTYTANLFTPVLTDIELNGMFLDKDRVDQVLQEYVELQLAVDEELSEMANGVNFASAHQTAHYIYEQVGFKELTDRKGSPIRNAPNKQFPDGMPKTDKETLLKLKCSNDTQRRLVELLKEKSKLDKAIGTYLNLFKRACDENEGHIYGRFNQAVTQTHRLSSSGPNFQNFDKKFKPLFRSRSDDMVIGERDAAQLEFRVATCLGDDAVGKQDIRDGFDVHSYSAGIIFRGEWEDRHRTPYLRQGAKPHTFKPLYGGTSGTESEQAYYRAFREKYSGVSRVQDGWVDQALSRHYTDNVTGLRWYWPQVRITRTGYVEGNTNVRNYPIQYLATGEIIPIGVTYTWHKMKEEGLKSLLVNTVHDSMITEEYPEETERLDEITKEAFSEHVLEYMRNIYNFDFDVPLDIDSSQNTHWGIE